VDAIVNPPVRSPLVLMVQESAVTIFGAAGDCMKLPVGLHGLAASAVSNPPPVAVTWVPIGPELGVRVRNGPVTVKLAEAESPVLPVTVRVYTPGVAPDLIVNPAVN